MGKILVERSSWPEYGRMGRITAGQYADAYLLLVAEVDDSWAFYISDDPRVQDDPSLRDDFWAKDEMMPRLIDEMKVAWVDISEDVSLEKEIFDIRSEWHRRRRRREAGKSAVRAIRSFLRRR